MAPAKPRLSRTRIEASFAVYAMRGAGTDADGVPAGCDDTLLGNRYIRRWRARHRHGPAPRLIATLAAALETARSHELGLVLPELPATMPAPL